MTRWLLMALLVASPSAAQLVNPAASQPFTAEQRAAIVDILREALVADPTILRDAVTALQEAEQREAAAAQAQAMVAREAELLRNPADPVLGNPNGDVTVVEFYDYRCPYCRRAHPEVRALLASDRNVRYVAKELPILGPASQVAARIALAAHRQGKWEAVNMRLMNLPGEPTEANMIAAAAVAGADVSRLRQDMQDPAIATQLTANLALARALGITGTPAFVIGGRITPGAVDRAELARLVAAARAR
jgi:protein-disulfide isomerase